MIYDKQGVPLNEVLMAAALGKREAEAARTARRTGLVRDEEGNPVYRFLKNGVKVFRALFKQTGRYNGEQLRAIRAAKGVGRPIKGQEITAVYTDEFLDIAQADLYASAVALHGSQRKAAAALGISLGKLQRGLRKNAPHA